MLWGHMVNVVSVSKLSMFLEQQGAKNEESCCQLSFHKYTKLDLIFLHGAVELYSAQTFKVFEEILGII